MALRKIRRWFDGDSGEFSNGDQFRLAEVRAPEKHQFGGSKATRRVAGMTGRSNGKVNVRAVARDSYGRSVVYMSNKDGSVNQRMKQRGCRSKGK